MANISESPGEDVHANVGQQWKRQARKQHREEHPKEPQHCSLRPWSGCCSKQAQQLDEPL